MASEDELPRWFAEAVSAPCESRFVDVHGCAVHYLHWKMRPLATSHQGAGIIFVHGNGAHAHWWDFVAPFFTGENDCLAVSNSGSGRSAWREAYSFELWAEELMAAAEQCGMLQEAGTRCKPLVVAHSMGVMVAVALARRFGAQIGGLVLLDEVPRPAAYLEAMFKGFAPPIRPRGKQEARPAAVSPRSRFSLAPPQPERNRYLLDHVADRSVKFSEDGSSWEWCFDPQKVQKLPPDEGIPGALAKFLSAEAIRSLAVRVSFVVGDSSALCSRELVEWARRELGEHVPFVEIADAGHHIMFDQPLALVAAIRATISEWRRSATVTPAGLSLPRLEERASHSAFVGDGSGIPVRRPWQPGSKL
mmetsp:Transcript_20336/g.63759  ORF Transcript_20336/g.63759 Transcript_20336/m.63759 type:complete len:362 (+) Transcript_20336:84-1169(+)